MLTLFFLLAGLLAVQSLIALQDGPRFLAFVRRRLGQPLADYAPPATVTCPCKGWDADLEANLRALLAQDYPDYEVVFVLAAADDPARAVCEGLARAGRVPARVVIAGAPAGPAGRPAPGGIRTLTAHLAEPEVGAASTFRWYIPDRDFLSGLQSAWNAPAVAYIGEWKRNFCW